MATILEAIRGSLGVLVPPVSEEPAPAAPPPPPPSVVQRFQKFLWVWSGMFAIAALALAFTGYFTIGAYETAASNFLAAVVASALFGVASVLEFGPASD